MNLVCEITEKSKIIFSDKFGIETELNSVLEVLEKEMDYYFSKIIKSANEKNWKFVCKLKRLLIRIE